ncbi:MAG: hypothetical protein CMH46_17000 [Muricauda sp.]|nr:hypothetical protein [Allomuricauda sp.]
MTSNNKITKTALITQFLFFGLVSSGQNTTVEPSTHLKVQVDKPGKLTHLRRIKLTIANELPRFDLSLG